MKEPIVGAVNSFNGSSRNIHRGDIPVSKTACCPPGDAGGLHHRRATRSDRTPGISILPATYRRQHQCMVNACFDALVFIPNCDKIVPELLAAAGLVSVFVSGGPMLDGQGDLNTVLKRSALITRARPTRERCASEESACPAVPAPECSPRTR